jgi:hypothetical protein
MLKFLPRCPNDLTTDLPCAANLSRPFATMGVRKFDYSKRPSNGDSAYWLLMRAEFLL